MTTDLKAQILTVLVECEEQFASMHKSFLKNPWVVDCQKAIALLQDPNVFVGKWEPIDVKTLKREIISKIIYKPSIYNNPYNPNNIISATIDHLHQRGLLTPPPPKDTK